MPTKEKIVKCFKILSILILSLIIVDFLNTLNKEEIINIEIVKEKENQRKINKIYPLEIYSLCEENINKNSEVEKTRYTYYSFAVILGAFINSKKIMKIGVI